jgi:hypothetical protein
VDSWLRFGVANNRLRLSMAFVSLLTIALGVWAGGLAQVGALPVLFVIILSWEHAAAKPAFKDTTEELKQHDSMEVS